MHEYKTLSSETVSQVGLSFCISIARHQQRTSLHLLLRLCLAQGETLSPAPWSNFRTENRHCQLQIQPHTQADIWFVQGELLKVQVCFCRRNICAFVFPWGTVTFPGAGAALQAAGPALSAAAARGQRLGTVTTALLPRNAPGMLILCSRWLSRWFLASSLVTIHIYRQIKDSNKCLFN